MRVLTALFGFLLALVMVVTVSPVYAQSINFDPASGSFTNDFSIDVSLDTDTESIAGVSIEVSYDESLVSYTGYLDGDVPCDPLTVSNNSATGTVSIDCLIDLAAPANGSFTGSGTLAQLDFNPVGNGDMDLTITITDDGGVTYTTANGSYTIAASGTLPDTNVLLNSIVVVGLGLIGMGMLWVRYGEGWMRTVGGTRWLEGRLSSRF